MSRKSFTPPSSTLGCAAALPNTRRSIADADIDTRAWPRRPTQVTIITISKRLALTEFHAHELQFGAPTSKGWDYHSIPHDDSDEA